MILTKKVLLLTVVLAAGVLIINMEKQVLQYKMLHVVLSCANLRWLVLIRFLFWWCDHLLLIFILYSTFVLSVTFTDQVHFFATTNIKPPSTYRLRAFIRNIFIKDCKPTKFPAYFISRTVCKYQPLSEWLKNIFATWFLLRSKSNVKVFPQSGFSWSFTVSLLPIFDFVRPPSLLENTS